MASNPTKKLFTLSNSSDLLRSQHHLSSPPELEFSSQTSERRDIDACLDSEGPVKFSASPKQQRHLPIISQYRPDSSDDSSLEENRIRTSEPPLPQPYQNNKKHGDETHRNQHRRDRSKQLDYSEPNIKPNHTNSQTGQSHKKANSIHLDNQVKLLQLENTHLTSQCEYLERKIAKSQQRNKQLLHRIANLEIQLKHSKFQIGKLHEEKSKMLEELTKANIYRQQQEQLKQHLEESISRDTRNDGSPKDRNKHKNNKRNAEVTAQLSQELLEEAEEQIQSDSYFRAEVQNILTLFSACSDFNQFLVGLEQQKLYARNQEIDALLTIMSECCQQNYNISEDNARLQNSLKQAVLKNKQLEEGLKKAESEVDMLQTALLKQHQQWIEKCQSHSLNSHNINVSRKHEYSISNKLYNNKTQKLNMSGSKNSYERMLRMDKRNLKHDLQQIQKDIGALQESIMSQVGLTQN